MMKLSKSAAALVAVVTVGFLIAILGLVGWTAARADEPVGRVGHILQETKNKGLHGTALSPADVYGEEWTAAAFVCPGVSGDELREAFGLNPDELDLVDGKVPEDTNYLVALDDDLNTFPEKLDRSEVDLCSQQAPPVINGFSLLPFMQNQDGTWVLAS